ncbi:probable calcium-binding protein CML44 [Mangifera indica]|uniref:probable calcium-binding protein CML44 n=1 Tax=Mangifera indica TaxID=29780 RepID=UPI001CFA49B3|nr:probable calcium-binding protein CML44 [Mangifera indica]
MCPLNAVDLYRIFTELDKNGDNLLSLEELNWLLEKIGVHYSLSELESLLGKQTLDFNQFLFFWDSISKRNSSSDVNHEGEDDDDETDVIDAEADLAKAFNVFDINGDGFISSDELQNVLSRLGLWDEKNGKDCKSMICMYDTNLDGVLDFEEFKNMMLQTSS